MHAMDHSGGRSRPDAPRPDETTHAPTLRTRAQLSDIGLTRTDFTLALERGWLTRRRRGIYELARTELHLRMLLVLARSPDAVFSHRTAAHVHGLRKGEPAVLDVIVPRHRASPRGAVGHPRRHAQRTTVAGLPVTTVAATLADLLDVWTARAVAETIDRCFPTHESRRRVLADARALPPKQARRLVPLLEWAPTNMRSRREAQLARALQMRGWKVLLNVRIGPYLWDVYIVEARLVVEFDSVLYHSDPEAFRQDLARQNNLLRRDVGLLRYTDFDVDHRFDAIIDEVCDEAAHRLGRPRTLSQWDRRHCRDIYYELEADAIRGDY